MCHGPLSIVGKVACLISALAALKIGLHELGYDVMASVGVVQGTPTSMYLHYVIGVAGLISLIKLGMCGYACMTGSCSECKSRR